MMKGREVAILDDWGKLRSVGGWGELQRSHSMTVGAIRRIGDRAFISQRTKCRVQGRPGGKAAAALVRTSDLIASDADLLVEMPHTISSAWPTEMRPAGTDGAALAPPLPL
jgi:hypothetical protein